MDVSTVSTSVTLWSLNNNESLPLVFRGIDADYSTDNARAGDIEDAHYESVSYTQYEYFIIKLNLFHKCYR